jgi:uncharacterized protein RhaS with RHS repeats
LYYYRARYYDPQLKRFISVDPIGLDGGVNVYGYVNGNPIGYVDPDGLAAQVCLVNPAACAIVIERVVRLCATAANAIAAAIAAGYIVETYDCENDNSCPDNDSDDCDKLYATDTSTCNGIARVRGARAGAVCHASASERYAACLAGRQIPPLNTWNN